MKQSYLLTSSLFLLFACAACEEDDKMDMDKIDVPNGYALSAGTSTIFLNSSVAYDTNADWITGANSIRFNNGDGLYDDVRTSNNGDGGGLGPVYAGYSCGSCHRNAGRTKPTLWENGGSGMRKNISFPTRERDSEKNKRIIYFARDIEYCIFYFLQKYRDKRLYFKNRYSNKRSENDKTG